MLLHRALVPTDFSPRSRAALRYALTLADRGAELDLLHVLPAPHRLHIAVDAYLGLPFPIVPEVQRDQAECQLETLCSSVPHEGVQLNRLVECGHPAATIVRIAAERKAALIVIATHGRSGIAEAVLGSVAHQILCCAPCPVLVLRGDEANLNPIARTEGL
jgi:nucleotide-binding universal stress UspA family protein